MGKYYIDEFRGSYRFLSNFYEHLSEMSNEHLYQAMKTTDWRQQIVVLSAGSAGEAKTLGRMVTLRPEWDEIKDDVMLELLRLKFAMGTRERFRLIETGDAELTEGNNWGDRYWGKVNGTGKNMLGKLLMQVRQEIKDGKL